MTFLEVKNLSVKFPDFKALEGISFSAEEGKITAIIGPNGAGKTVLFRALLGVLPYEGEIIWHKKPTLGYVPQRLEFDRTFPLTVKELLLLKTKGVNFWLPKESALKEVVNSLNHTRAGHLLDKRVGKLSGGELQRVLIAYAIFGQSDFLLFDEPLSGIDIEGEMTIYGLIKHLAKELNLTVLFISHDLNIVSEYADSVICLNKKLFCSGVPEKILTPEQLKALYGAPITFYLHKHEEPVKHHHS